jgi:D-alanine-D-alanine ligase
VELHHVSVGVGQRKGRSDAAGRPQFMEVNPLAGLHPTHSDLPILAAQAGIPYEKLIGRILRQGLQRAGLSRRPQPQIVAAE